MLAEKIVLANQPIIPASYDKSVDNLQQIYYQQADMWISSHGLRQLADDKCQILTDLLQPDEIDKFVATC